MVWAGRATVHLLQSKKNVGHVGIWLAHLVCSALSLTLRCSFHACYFIIRVHVQFMIPSWLWGRITLITWICSYFDFLKVFQLVLQCERECCMFCQKEINSWHYHCNNFCNNLDMILKGIQLSPVHQLGKTDFCTCMHVLLLKLVSISCI